MRKGFVVGATEGHARVGVLTLAEGDATAAGPVDTPTCMMNTRQGTPPVLMAHLLEGLGADLSLIHVNMQGIWSSPGAKVLEASKAASFQKFMNLPSQASVYCSATDPSCVQPDGFNGDTSVSIWGDGGRRQITAEEYMRMVALCRPHMFAALGDVQTSHAGLKRQRKAVERSVKMLDKCLELAKGVEGAPLVLATVVGGKHEALRRMSAKDSAARPVHGFVIDGLNTGEAPSETTALLRAVIADLPADKLRVAHGLDTPERVLEAVSEGVDILDNYYPYSVAEDGCALTFALAPAVGAQASPRKINIWDAEFRTDFKPLVEGCTCYACQKHTRAYIHHLLVTHEMLASVLLVHHNFHHFYKFFEAIRGAIEEQRFDAYRTAFLAIYSSPSGAGQHADPKGYKRKADAADTGDEAAGAPPTKTKAQ